MAIRNACGRTAIIDRRYSGRTAAAVLLLLAAAAGRASTLTESAAASDLAAAQTCNAVSTLGSLAPQALVSSGATAGSYSITISKGASQEFLLYSASGVPNAGSWPAGNWVVKLNVTTGNSNLTWADTCILRVSSSGALVQSVGQLTGGTTGLGSAGVVTETVSGSAASGSTSDRIAVAVILSNGAAHSNESLTLGAGNATNDIVTTPLANSYSASISETLSQSDSLARQAGFGRGMTDAPATSDAIAKSAGFPAALAESEAVADSLARQAGLARAASEAETPSDALLRRAAFLRAGAETESLADSLAAVHQSGQTAAPLHGTALSGRTGGTALSGRTGGTALSGHPGGTTLRKPQ